MLKCYLVTVFNSKMARSHLLQAVADRGDLRRLLLEEEHRLLELARAALAPQPAPLTLKLS